jgi:uncharacterized cupin superfamily protein
MRRFYAGGAGGATGPARPTVETLSIVVSLAIRDSPTPEVRTMSTDRSKKIRVVKPEDVVWKESIRGPEEHANPGQECTVVKSEDEKFTTGLWQREEQDRYFERPYHEIAFIIEGEVEITDMDGDVVRAGPGDILITPKGSMGHWKNLSPVKKFWAIYEEPGGELKSYLGPGAF